MSFSDDPASPAAPFSGDDTGAIFDAPDMVWQSPTTSERVVDTQSGFLLVLKRQDGRQALSVKRRLGTPPSSSVLLTPDESLKLSRILVGSGPAERGSKAASYSVDQLLSAVVEPEPGQRAKARSVWLDATPSYYLKPYRRPFPPLNIGLPGFSLLTAFLLFVAGMTGYLLNTLVKPQSAVLAGAPADPLAMSKVDTYARRFVSNMLDFNPDTYKVSQVRAMAAMSPELVESYWQDTNFPLSRRQLKTLPQGTTVVITKVTQDRLGAQQAEVDIYAELVRPDSKVSNPLHLELRLAVDAEGEVRVLEQKDLSAGSHQS